jgi:hypothetical protein
MGRLTAAAQRMWPASDIQSAFPSAIRSITAISLFRCANLRVAVCRIQAMFTAKRGRVSPGNLPRTVGTDPRARSFRRDRTIDLIGNGVISER